MYVQKKNGSTHPETSLSGGIMDEVFFVHFFIVVFSAADPKAYYIKTTNKFHSKQNFKIPASGSVKPLSRAELSQMVACRPVWLLST